jgi:RNA polymerase sporulation-specific sigma factor
LSDKKQDYSLLNDDELALLAQTGDEVAFNLLAKRYLQTKVKKSKSAYLEVEDFLQESMFGFMSAVRTFDSSRGVPFKAYASKCMHNSMESAVVDVSPEILVENNVTATLSTEVEEDPLDLIIGSEQLGSVLQLCQVTLSSLEKTVVFLKAGGMSYAEIGERLGMDAKAVDNAVQRARRKLKNAITE